MYNIELEENNRIINKISFWFTKKDREIYGNVNNRIQTKWFKWMKATEILYDRKVQDKVKKEVLSGDH